MSRRLWIAVLATIVVLTGAAGSVWYFVFRDDSPAGVSLRRATASLDAADADDADADRGNGASGDLAGTWTVDKSVGRFSDFTSSFVGFRVQEQLVGIGAKTAVGRTPSVTGMIVLDGTTLTSAEFEVDMTTLRTDDSRRDDAIRRQGIETSRFPTAGFVLTRPVQLSALPGANQKITVEATGDLTLHGVTRTITLPLEAQHTGDVIAVVGTIDVEFADYDIRKPTAASVLSVEDRGVIELQLFFTKTR
jgi:polyisoprenoid-binding protein YceI